MIRGHYPNDVGPGPTNRQHLNQILPFVRGNGAAGHLFEAIIELG